MPCEKNFRRLKHKFHQFVGAPEVSQTSILDWEGVYENKEAVSFVGRTVVTGLGAASLAAKLEFGESRSFSRRLYRSDGPGTRYRL